MGIFEPQQLREWEFRTIHRIDQPTTNLRRTRPRPAQMAFAFLTKQSFLHRTRSQIRFVHFHKIQDLNSVAKSSEIRSLCYRHKWQTKSVIDRCCKSKLRYFLDSTICLAKTFKASGGTFAPHKLQPHASRCAKSAHIKL